MGGGAGRWRTRLVHEQGHVCKAGRGAGRSLSAWPQDTALRRPLCLCNGGAQVRYVCKGSVGPARRNFGANLTLKVHFSFV